jgi:hypothetical protein
MDIADGSCAPWFLLALVTYWAGRGSPTSSPQLGEVLPEGGPAESARRAAEALFRGVVAGSSVVPATDPANG